MTQRDALYTAINGAIFGAMLPIILTNIGITTTPTIPVAATLFAALALCGVYIFSLLSRIRNFFFQLGKFSTVGAANAAIDFGVLNFLIMLTGVTTGIAYALFKLSSFVVANINSYFWNKRWSFESASKNSHKEFLQFFAVGATGALVNVLIASLVNALLGHFATVAATTSANIAALVASAGVMAWNFLGYKLIVFKK